MARVAEAERCSAISTSLCKDWVFCVRMFWSGNARTTGNEIMRKLKALGKTRHVAVRLDASRGKGSHQTP